MSNTQNTGNTENNNVLFNPENAKEEAPRKNDTRKSDLMKQVSKFGEEAALGRDSLPKLAHAVVRAAADGVISADDADDVYARYAASESKKSIHEHSAGGRKANVSKLRQLINLGEMTTVDAVELMQDAFEVREEVIATGGKVKSAYPFYVEVARAQLKEDAPLSREALAEMVAQGGAAPKSVEGELKRAMKILESLVTGENKDNLQDASENTIGAFELVRERLDQLTMISKRHELAKQAAALGLEIVG